MASASTADIRATIFSMVSAAGLLSYGRRERRLNKLRRDIKAELDESRLDKWREVISILFDIGESAGRCEDRRRSGHRIPEVIEVVDGEEEGNHNG